MCVEVRGQREEVGSLLSLHGPWGLNSGHWTLQNVPLPIGIFCKPVSYSWALSSCSVLRIYLFLHYMYEYLSVLPKYVYGLCACSAYRSQKVSGPLQELQTVVGSENSAWVLCWAIPPVLAFPSPAHTCHYYTATDGLCSAFCSCAVSSSGWFFRGN